MAELEDKQARFARETAVGFSKLDRAVKELARSLEVPGAGSTIDRSPGGASTFIPSQKQRDLWHSYLKRSIELGLRKWTKVKAGRSIRKWISRKEARGFKAPARNQQLPPLKTPSEQELDRSLKVLQNEMGAQAAVMLELWECISKLRKHQTQMFRAAKQDSRSSKVVPKAEEILELAISGLVDGSKVSRAFIDQEIGQGMEGSLRLSAAMFSRITLYRRGGLQ